MAEKYCRLFNEHPAGDCMHKKTHALKSMGF
jgi:hypothetical protein